MSTPLVAGGAALIRQYLIEQRGHFELRVKPSGALIKAMLINGAEVMLGQFPGEIPAGPNVVSGFGRVNIAKSLTANANTPVLFDDEPEHAVETGQTRTFRVQVEDMTQPLRVTLVWTDAPRSSGIGGLENQLYLQVRRPNGVTRSVMSLAFLS